jgi:hypothetical protein
VAGTVDVGKGAKPICDPAQLGCCSFAPLAPHAVQRALRRSRSLDVSGPYRMISGANAIGASAKTLSLTVPLPLLGRADEVIE